MRKSDPPTPLRGGRALVRLSLPAGVILALASVAYGLVSLGTPATSHLAPLITYSDTRTELVSVKPGRRVGGGGCNPGVYPDRAVVEAIVTTPDDSQDGSGGAYRTWIAPA